MKDLEYRAINDLTVSNVNNQLQIEGIVNNIGEFSKVLGGTFREKINAGVFTRAIENAKGKSDIFFLHQHDTKGLPLASVNSNTLELNEVDGALKMRAILPDTTFNRDIHALVKSGVLTEFSFGFSNPQSKWSVGADGINERTITDFDLSEISIVRIGAYNDTTAFARAIEECREAIEPGVIPKEQEFDISIAQKELESKIAELEAEKLELEAKKQEIISKEADVEKAKLRVESEKMKDSPDDDQARAMENRLKILKIKG